MVHLHRYDMCVIGQVIRCWSGTAAVYRTRHLRKHVISCLVRATPFSWFSCTAGTINRTYEPRSYAPLVLLCPKKCNMVSIYIIHIQLR